MKVKQIANWLPIAALLAAPLTGCGSSVGAGGEGGASSIQSTEQMGRAGAEAPEGFPTEASKDGKYEPQITLTTVRPVNDMMQTKGIDQKADVMEDNIWYNDFRDILGINVENQWTVPDSQYAEKMNAQIAANDLPDFFRVNGSQLKQLSDYGMLYDLTDVFREYASDFTNQMMKADNNVARSQATIDNKLYALPVVGGNKDGAAFWWVRKDWMDKLGIEEPKTMDELIDMCRRFTNEDPDGNGLNDTVGMGLTKDLFGNYAGINAFGEGFHAYLDSGDWLMVDGEAQFGGIQPEAKTAIQKLADMYQEGILDKEFIVKDGSKISEEIIAGKIGCFGGNHALAFWPLQEVKNNNPDAEFVALPIVPNDDKPVKVMIGGSAGDFCVVQANCKNPEAVVKLYNYFYLKDSAISPEFDLNYHGKLDSTEGWPIGESYIWAPMTPTYPQQNMFIQKGVDEYVKAGDEKLLDNYWISDNVESYEAFVNGDLSRYGTAIWSGPGEYSAFGRINYYENHDMFTQNVNIGIASDSQIQYSSTLNQLRLEAMTKIIMGEMPISEFDNFAEQWKSLGGDWIKEEINANLEDKGNGYE